MGSRLMHTIIAHEVASRFQIKDSSSFILGGIAPDAVSPKDFSHFYKGNGNDYSRSIDYHAFIHKYYAVKKSPYILGYYSHLIADEIWLTGFFLPWLKNRLENDPAILERYHNDFRLLNARLAASYQIDPMLLDNLVYKGQMLELDEVSIGQVTSFLPLVQGDLNAHISEVPLQVFTMEQIVGYIETSVDKSCQKIKEILSA